MTEFVCRRTGRAYQVGEQLDQDGHAVVHTVVCGGPDLALKQYLPATLQRRPDLEARIKAMIANPPAYRPDPSGPVICAWPEDTAYISGQFAGFVMPRVDTREAVTIPDLATHRATTWRERLAVAVNLTRAVAVLHDRDVVVGDFRKWNLLTWSDSRVTLLGCDRMQVVDPESGRRFPSVAGRDACTPPELQLPATLSSTIRTSSSDIFGLALHLHLLLLQGAHPFRGQWTGGGDSPPEHLLAQEGLWAYAGDRRLDPCPGSAPLMVLPATLQQYFRAAFVDGARNPDTRPPAQDWLNELLRLHESLVTCAVEPTHSYGRHLSSCPWCPGSPSRAGSTPPGLVPRQASTGPPRAAMAVPVNAAAPPPAHDDLAAAGTRPAPPARPNRATPSGTRRLDSDPARRHRSALRLAAWAAAAVVAIGGIVAVNTVSRRAAPPVHDPTVSAQARTTSTPPPLPRPTDPAEALEQIRAQDAPVVETLADSWVAQLSTRPAGTQSADRTAMDAAILAGHDALRNQHPGAVLLRSTDWNYHGQSWITVMNKRFPTAEEANTWCDTNRFAPQDCFAKNLSHTGVVEGSTRYRT
jgi:DNA-binding helix-hairpin-helix protein with protein kinase domain